MEDSAIIDLYWAREERALSETDTKYGGYCRSIAHNILRNRSVQSIAARYAIKENTAKSILFRTREKLRRYLAGEGIIV